MDQTGGLAGWRWLFILEGIPSCLSAFLVFFFLPDYPESAGWLTESEKDLAVQRLYHEGSKGHHPSMTWQDAKSTLTDWRLYAHYIMYFAVSPPFASLSLFSPSITSGLGYVDLKAQLMTVPPWVVAYGKPLGSFLSGFILITKERIWSANNRRFNSLPNPCRHIS